MVHKGVDPCVLCKEQRQQVCIWNLASWVFVWQGIFRHSMKSRVWQHWTGRRDHHQDKTWIRQYFGYLQCNPWAQEAPRQDYLKHSWSPQSLTRVEKRERYYQSRFLGHCLPQVGIPNRDVNVLGHPGRGNADLTGISLRSVPAGAQNIWHFSSKASLYLCGVTKSQSSGRGGHFFWHCSSDGLAFCQRKMSPGICFEWCFKLVFRHWYELRVLSWRHDGVVVAEKGDERRRYVKILLMTRCSLSM